MTGLEPFTTGGPAGVCILLAVGLAGVINSAGRIHEGEHPGHAVLSTFPGAASTIRLGLSMLHILADSVSLNSDFPCILAISVLSA